MKVYLITEYEHDGSMTVKEFEINDLKEFVNKIMQTKRKYLNFSIYSEKNDNVYDGLLFEHKSLTR